MPTRLIGPFNVVIIGIRVAATLGEAKLSRLLAYSLDYRKAGKDAAKRLLEPKEAYRRLYSLVEGIVVLSTCARYEIYMDIADRSAGLDDAVREVYGDYYGLASRLEGIDAVRHLFRVAAGLESPIIGEPEILGQVKNAWLHAKENLYTSRLIDMVFHRAIVAGKRARSETGISRGVIGYPQAAVITASRIIGDLNGKKIAVIGAGQAASSIVSFLCSRWEPGLLVVYNRTPGKAKSLASKCPNGLHRSLKEMNNMVDYDAVFVAVSGFNGGLRGLEKAGVIVDISIPPVIGKGGGLRVLHLEDVKRVSMEGIASRNREASKVELIVIEEVRKLIDAVKAEEANAAVAAIFEYVRASATAERQLTLKSLSRGEDVERVLEIAFDSFSRKILRPLVLALRKIAREGDMRAIDIIREAYRRELGGE